MLDEKRIKQIKTRIEKFQSEGIILKDASKFVDFFLNNSKNSLDSANLLFNVSSNEELKKSLGFYNFNGFLWVINSSYYSMFYLVRALLEKEGIKIKPESSIHSIVFDCLVFYFYLTGKLEKSIIEEFENAEEEVTQILGKEKAKELVEDYYNEKEKRGRFTYELGEIAMKNKAQTSLDRAKKFNEEIRKILDV